MTETTLRRVPVGVEIVSGGCHFRVWAPEHKKVDVVLEERQGHAHPLEAEANGYFSGLVPEGVAGSRYKYRLSGGDTYPDPASRFQPEGPHEPSQVVDSTRFRWTDTTWSGVKPQGQIIYELHVGTFTPEGTWDAAAERLEWLRDTGITVIEVMPVNEFPGRFGWGYDGVDLFAPTHLYGTPDDFRALRRPRARARARRHPRRRLQPPRSRRELLGQFSPDYFSQKHKTDWGERASTSTARTAAPVREFFIANAGYWISEFHLDGLRLDATQNIYDDSPEHILAAIVRAARQAAGTRARSSSSPRTSRRTRTRAARPKQGGYGLDTLWNDDFHHSAMVAMTGHNEAYYTDYHGRPAGVRLAPRSTGYLYQGQWYAWQKQAPRHAAPRPPAGGLRQLHPEPRPDRQFRAAGCACRELTGPGRYRAMTALTPARPGHADAVPGPGVRRVHALLLLRRPQARAGASSSRKGRRELMLQFATSRHPRCSTACPILPI